MNHENTSKGERDYCEVATFQQKGGSEMPPQESFSPTQEREKVKIPYIVIVMVIMMIGMIVWNYQNSKDNKLIQEQLSAEFETINDTLQQVVTEEDVSKLVDKKVEQKVASLKEDKGKKSDKEQLPEDSQQQQPKSESVKKGKKKTTEGTSRPQATPNVISVAKRNKTESTAKQKQSETAKVLRSGIYMYEKPSRKSKRIATLVSKEVLTDVVLVNAKSNDQDAIEGWIRGQRSNGEVGYVDYYETDFIEGKKGTYHRYPKGTTGTMQIAYKLYEKPWKSSDVLKFLSKDAYLEVLGYVTYVPNESPGIFKVSIPNSNWVGWISGKYIHLNFGDEDEETESSRSEMTDNGSVKAYGLASGKKTTPAMAKSATSTSATTASGMAESATSTSATTVSGMAETVTLTPATTASGMTETATSKLSMKALTLATKKPNSARNKKSSAKKKVTRRTTTYGIVNGRRVNLRKSPSIQSKIKGAYSRNRKLVILSKKGSWYKVQIGKVKGFMYGRYVKKTVSYGEITGSEGIQELQDLQEKEDDSSNKKEEISDAVNTLTPVKVEKKYDGTKKAPKKTKKEYVKKICKERFDWGDIQYKYADAIFEQESGYNEKCKNPKSGCLGIAQMHPCHNIPDQYKKDWTYQIRWGLKYMKQQYGSPKAAWKFKVAHGWY